MPVPQAPSDVLAPTAEGLHLPGRARYVVLSAPEGAVEAGAYAGMDALHRYFDGNKTGLISQWRELETARIIQERQRSMSPTREPDAVIKFWPKRGSRYLQPGTSSGWQMTNSTGKEAQ